MHRLRNTILLVLIAWCALVGGRAAAAALPQITEHSDTEFAVYQGDTVAVEVKVKNARKYELEAKWLESKRRLCRSLSCELDTSGWDLGRHRIVFVLFNKAGSKFLHYSVRILKAPKDRRPAHVHPDLVPARDQGEVVAASDMVVRTVHGRGYSYHAHKLQIIGPMARTLDWREGLRTARDSTMEFGRSGQEAHILAGRAAAKLLRSESNRRAIVLKRGTLRSRSLGPKPPRWSIVVPELLQVDTDGAGDVLVSRDAAGAGKSGIDLAAPEDDEEADTAATDEALAPTLGEAVTITVLRGRARVFIRRHGDSQGPDAGQAVVVAAGLSLTVRSGEEPEAPGLPEPKVTGQLVALTTPQYLPEDDSAEASVPDGLAFTGAASKHQNATLKAALKEAATLLARGDAVLTLELLRPFRHDVRDNFAAQLAFGEAYKQLFLFGAAEDALHAASDIDPTAAKPHELLGSMALMARDWAGAKKELSTAADLGADSPQLFYELGVGAYFAKDYGAARGALQQTLWAGDSPELTASARDFLRRLEGRTWYELRGRAGVYYDSNILRSDSLDPASLAQGLSSRKGAGYLGSFGFSLFPVRSDSATISVAFDDGKRGYFNKSLAPVAVIEQTLALGASLGFGEARGGKALVLSGQLLARSLAVGGERSIDELGELISVSSPALYDLHVSVESTRAIDPLPARNIIMDPLRWEVVKPGDRSCSLLYYELGATPLKTDSIQLGVQVRRGSVSYLSTFEQDENLVDLGGSASFTYISSPRSTYHSILTANSRQFKASDDGRKDKTYQLGTDWQWHFNQYLSQTLQGSYERQSSSRGVNAYKRMFVSYWLQLDL